MDRQSRPLYLGSLWHHHLGEVIHHPDEAIQRRVLRQVAIAGVGGVERPRHGRREWCVGGHGRGARVNDAEGNLRLAVHTGVG